MPDKHRHQAVLRTYVATDRRHEGIDMTSNEAMKQSSDHACRYCGAPVMSHHPGAIIETIWDCGTGSNGVVGVDCSGPMTADWIEPEERMHYGPRRLYDHALAADRRIAELEAQAARQHELVTYAHQQRDSANEQCDEAEARIAELEALAGELAGALRPFILPVPGLQYPMAADALARFDARKAGTR